jgi:acyl transferase domain-containing protein/NAD(P)-dependent dehydrogenase (short-subunit alcohol dehydrogenase family)
MENTAHRAIAVVGAGAILPDAANVAAFWENVKTGRYSITEVAKERWDPARYYDADHSAPDKTYSKIGGWVREYVWDPVKWHLPVPPRVVQAMDEAQQWAIACTREALEDYGYPNRPLDLERTAVILGNAMAGEKHYLTALRVFFPEYAAELEASASFAALPPAVRRDITRELHDRMAKHLPEVTEDSMPGELANCIAGRIANIFNLRGPNFVTDAACASAMAAISSAAEGLIEHDFDVAITGGIDRNMGAPTFVKFCKIGALSATGSRPYAEGADGFVMGEGCALLLLKRLADAERDQDKIYAVLRGMGGSSDGRGKGITAPNPIGQKICIERAWQNAGLSPATVSYIEGHGTSTRVGDVVEVQSAADVLNGFHLPTASVALGSVKSNIGHLKGAAGAAGFLKTVLALRDKVLPPSVHCEHPSPDIDFAHSPLFVNTSLKPWTVPEDSTRRAGLSAFGFGGTNFHAVLEEYVPHKLTGNGKRLFATIGVGSNVENRETVAAVPSASRVEDSHKAPLRGALLIGAPSAAALAERVRSVQKEAESGHAPGPSAPLAADLHASERLSIDYADAKELADKCAKALQALAVNQPAVWKAMRAQGIFRGSGPAPKVAFLYTGQGSQYANMLADLRGREPIVGETFAEADRIMTPLLGKPLSEFIFIDQTDAKAVAKAEDDLRQTAITQPAVLATDLALTRLLAAYGIEPDMTMGHSLGEYGALVASGALPFADALEAVSARGREMTRVSMKDNGRMAAVFAPIAEIERILNTVDGYVVIANINSDRQAVIGGASAAVTQAIEAFAKAGYEIVPLPVSHAFHTSIVAPASEPLRQTLERQHLQSPRVPVVANVNGEFYPTGPDAVPQMLDILARQVASPVQFVKGLRTLYAAGARVFVEAGPKKALQGFAEDVLGDRGDVLSLFTNHPKFGDVASFNQALCGLYASGLGYGTTANEKKALPGGEIMDAQERSPKPASSVSSGATSNVPPVPSNSHRYVELGRLFADALERGWQIWKGNDGQPGRVSPVVITGAALGLPGSGHVFDDANMSRILRGDQFIDVIPSRARHAMLDKHITRLVKSDQGAPVFETITNVADVIKLAGRAGTFNLEQEFGVSAERVAALDPVTSLAIAAGMDALRDAGIPLVLHYKTTSKGSRLPDRWGLPDSLRDDTGVIFASVFPGYDSFADEISRYFTDHERREKLALLQTLLSHITETNGHSTLLQEINWRIDELRAALEKEPYVFERRFLFRTLSMGHSQFAEYIGARGPNTQINAACASTTQAVAVAEDWIHAGRCRRVIIVSADDITTDHLVDWFGAGFLATGAAATDDVVENAAIPFDRRRHGMIIGMGAAALVVERAEAARERGLRPICEVLSAATANSAFHGTRLDVQHIGQVMEELIARAEAQGSISRRQIAPHTVFVSHETYTPARGGSASAEISALRRVFGDSADQIVITNTKGLTGHAMGAGIEDVVAVKALETGCVPPVVNFKEVDPELGVLNLSKGGVYPVEYALRLGAGFGSQISMTLYHWLATKDGARPNPSALGYASRIADAPAFEEWLTHITGQPSAELEVVHRTLRVQATKPATRPGEVVQEAIERSVAAAAKPQPAVSVSVAVAPAPSEREASQAQSVATRSQPTAAPSAPAPTPVAAPRQTPATTTPALVAPVMAPPPALAASTDAVKQQILSLVSEKTGYPPDMLDLDLDLEADLGVDTVKQAEVFAAIRELYNIPRDENRKLRDFPTLAHVIRFVYDKRPDLATAATAAPPTPAAQPKEQLQPQPTQLEKQAPEPVAPASSTDEVKERILALVVEKTGYPAEMLDLDLDLEADLGIDTVKQAEMFAAIREIYNIPRDENRKLRDYPTLAHVIRFVQEKRPDLAVSSPSLPTESAPPARPEATSTAAAVTPPPASASPAVAVDDIAEKVLDIVADKTGYPRDMLDLDLDLEADLGIDTVKQAEMFASVRAAFNIPRDENLKLRDFPTLAKVIQFATERIAATASTPVANATAVPADRQTQAKVTATAPVPATPTPEKRARPVALSLEPANSLPRRIPVPTLRPPLDMCKPTGVTLSFGQRVIVMPDKNGVADALTQQLQAKGVEVLRLDPAWTAEALTTELKTWTNSSKAIHGVYWLPALDHEGSLSGMDLPAWREALRVRVKSLFVAMRILYDQICAPNAFLVTATRLGGLHGYDDAGASAPLGGAVVGFTKTFKRERTEATVKTVDFAPDSPPPEIADLLIKETLRDPGAVEIGYKMGLRWSIGLEEQPAVDGHPGLILDSNSVFLITGAAGSIVSAITADLAAASGGTFYLLDLVPEPRRDDADLNRFDAYNHCDVNDKENLKRDLFARIQARGERATPALVEKELAALERAVAARNAIDAVQAAGGTAYYFAVDLTDPVAVAHVVQQVRQRSGRIDVLLHAAGMDRSHSLPDKDLREFNLVFDVKADGWFNLMHAIGDMPLAATVAFSSIAGRFGNAGQTDYSSANDLLCKLTSNLRTTRPATRAIAIDWTAWGGIGMASRGSIPKVMELAGIDMLLPEAGIPVIRRELTAGATRGEVVIAQRLGMLLNESDSSGGLVPSGTEPLADHATRREGPMLGSIAAASLYDGVRVETALDPQVQPFLFDHQIEGTPVLPGVMGIEAFAETALSMLPGWQIATIEDIRFLAPFKFYRSQARTLMVQARFHPKGDEIVALCKLLGSRTLPNQAEPQVTTHFVARVNLTKKHSRILKLHMPASPIGPLIEKANIYRLYFHGPAYQVLEHAWRDGNQIIGKMAANLPANHVPPDKPTALDPRLVELCFQTAGLFEMSALGRMGLPHSIERLAVAEMPDKPAGSYFSVIIPREDGSSFDGEVVDQAGNQYLELRGYRTIALPERVDAEPLKALQATAV